MKQAARRLGFVACGVAPPSPYPGGERFLEWLRDGCHGEMEWLARDPARRIDPRRVLADCRSVVVAYMNHYPGPLPPRPQDVPRGRIARYALGFDYHDVVLGRLRTLAALLDDPAACCYVDTGPVLERSVAEAAGLGWIGKNACLIVPGIGSFGFLGVILTRRELPPSAPGRVGCGTCAACAPCCPTGAIPEPGRIDARRCISYLTIELRGAIPIELRPMLGDRLFGCDDCQEPCPWNRKAPCTAEVKLQPLADRLWPRLDEVLGLDQEAFSARFRNSPINRAKRAGLARNAAVALGNSGDHRGIPPLRRALAADPSPLVRAHAAWALGRLGDTAGLLDARDQETDADVIRELAGALSAAGS